MANSVRIPDKARLWTVLFDLFGESVLATLPKAISAPARRYRVLVCWLSRNNELLAQTSRAMAYQTALRLFSRVMRGDTDVLDAELYNAAESPPLPRGVRLLDNLDARPEILRVDPSDLFEWRMK